MPESKPRKKPAPKKAPVPKKGPGLRREQETDFTPVEMPAQARRTRDPLELKPQPPVLPDIPEPATYAQVMVALAGLNPLEQGVALADAIKAMPSQADGSMPVAIPRQVRAPWAQHLRKLGVFIIPELATHQQIDYEGHGDVMANHTAGSIQKLTVDDFVQMAKEHNPDLAKTLDEAVTTPQKKEAMRKLLKKLPEEQRVALHRLQAHDPEDFTPT